MQRIASMASDALYVLGMIGLSVVIFLDEVADPMNMRRILAAGAVLGLLVGVCRVIATFEMFRFNRAKRIREEMIVRDRMPGGWNQSR